MAQAKKPKSPLPPIVSGQVFTKASLIRGVLWKVHIAEGAKRLKNLNNPRSFAPLRMTEGYWGELSKYLFLGDAQSPLWRHYWVWPGLVWLPVRSKPRRADTQARPDEKSLGDGTLVGKTLKPNFSALNVKGIIGRRAPAGPPLSWAGPGGGTALRDSRPRGAGGIGRKGGRQGIAHPVGLLAVVGQDAFLEQEV